MAKQSRIFHNVILAVLPILAASVGRAASPDPGEPSPFGVNFLKWEVLKGHANVWEELRTRMKIMKEAGIYWDRDGIDKNTVHPKPGVWNWEFTDRVVALAREQRIHLAVILMGGGPPRDEPARQDFADYVYAVVNRYKDWIKVWEIWNEPNIPSFWKNPDAHLYTLLLKEAYTAAKRADPACTVLAGSASGPGHDWANGIADNGGWPYFDAYSMHPYALISSPIRQRLDLIFRNLRRVIDSHGHKPVWITEVGWQARRNPQEEADQATKVFQTYVIALANGIRNIDYFCMDNYDNWGLIRSSQPFDPKPSYGALQRLTRALGSPGPAARFMGYLKTPAGTVAYVFAKPGRDRVVILWNNDEATRPVPLGQQAGLRAETILGDQAPVKDGVLTLGPTPVIVSGALANRIPRPDPNQDPFLIPRGTNILFNGSLDAGYDETSKSLRNPGNWSPGVFNAGGKEAVFGVTGQGRSNSTAVSISQSHGLAAWNNALVPIEPDKRYQLTGWMKTSNATGKNAIGMFWYNGNMWTPVGQVETRSLTGSQHWTSVSVDAVAPRNAAFLRVHLVSQDNSGTAWYDDVAVVEE